VGKTQGLWYLKQKMVEQLTGKDRNAVSFEMPHGVIGVRQLVRANN